MPALPIAGSSASSAVDVRQRCGDSAGVLVSVACLAHCLLAPALAALIPALAFGFDHRADRILHWVLLLLAAPISAWTFRHGIRSHGQRAWLYLGLVGLALMLAGVLLHSNDHSELWLTTAGVTVLAIAHVLNGWSSVRQARRLPPAPAERGAV